MGIIKENSFIPYFQEPMFIASGPLHELRFPPCMRGVGPWVEGSSA